MRGRYERALLAARDVGDLIRGRRPELTPPRRLQVGGGRGSFERVGEIWLSLLVDSAGLRPDSRVLDIGCGPGRVAIPLTSYLDQGRYEGFDIYWPAIRWCRRHISRRHPHFRFRLATVENRMYSPRGDQAASSFTFPYPDGCFDVAFAASVFTHMRPQEVDRYLGEAARVLVPDGRLVSSFFLLNEDSERYLGEDAPGELPFELEDSSGRSYRTFDRETPEHRIALRERDVRDMHASAGLGITAIEYGRWSRRTESRGRRQDLVIAERTALTD